MKPWYEDKKAKVVQFYFETKSVTLTQRKLPKPFKVMKPQSLTVTFGIVNKFLTQGTVRNNFKQHSGCKRSQRTSATVARVRDALQRRLRKSMRRLGQEVWCSRATAHAMERVGTKFLQLNHSPSYSSANGSSRTVLMLTSLKKPEIGRGSTSDSA